MNATRSAAGTRDRGPAPRRATAGSESVTWRGRASSGATPGTGSSHRSCGRVSLSPIAATHAPSASQPTARQTPSHGLIRLAGGRRADASGASSAVDRGRASAAARRRARRTTRSTRPSWTSMWTNRAAVRRRQRQPKPRPPDGSPCSRSPVGQDDPVAPVGRQPDDLEPAVGVGHVQERPVGQPARAPTSRLRLAGDDPLGAGRDVDERDLRRLEVVEAALGRDRDPRPSGDQAKASTSTPAAVRTRGLGGSRLVRGPAAARHRRVDEPDLRPAATAREERETLAVRRPARAATAARLGRRPASSASRRPRRPRSPRRGRTRAGGRRATTAGRRPASPTRSAGSDTRPGSDSVNSWRAPAASAV